VSFAGFAQGAFGDCTWPLVGLVGLHGVALLSQGVLVPPFAGFSFCGVAGVVVAPAAPVALLCPAAPDISVELPVTPVELLGVALSWVLDGVAGLAGVLVVVCEFVVVVVLLCGFWLAVSVLVLCASAIVPASIKLAARIDAFFM
jgi:hypothetical protein